jgi:hypothetical protein
MRGRISLYLAGLAALLLAGSPALTIPIAADQGGETPDSSQNDKMATAIVELSKIFLKDKEARRYDRAYAMLAPSMRAYLTPELFRDDAEKFTAQAGKPGEPEFTRFTWYRDPPDAPEPGLYAAVDFTGHYDDLALMCGYLMWHKLPDGSFKVVREEQNFIDKNGAQQMVPEQRRKLPEMFGCVSS